ncbi:MAG: hypothetical protein PV362_04145 [Providencia heimbachae]|nr:hypothetical protein [Providencia heimbachae]
MKIDENIINTERYYHGLATFENFWGEDLILVEIHYHISDIINNSEARFYKRKFIRNVPDKSILKDVFSFKYELGVSGSYDYWQVLIETQSGKVYKTKDNFYCSIKKEDHGQVTLGVNGESKKLYVHFPSSSDCSTALKLKD